MEAKKPKHTYVKGETLEQVQSKTEWVTKAGDDQEQSLDLAALQKKSEASDLLGESVDGPAGQLKFYFPYADDKAMFTPSELTQIKSICDPGIC
jgi:hypothetical protein